MFSLPFGSVARQWRPVWSCEPETNTVASFCATLKSRVQGRSAAVSVFLQGGVEHRLVFPVEIRGQDAIFRGVLAQGVEQRVGHIGLEANGLGLANPLEDADHHPPGMHAAPADLAFRSQLFSVVSRDRAGLPERLGNFPDYPAFRGGLRSPPSDAETSRFWSHSG